MATPTIKTTYALDVESVRTLDELARRWNVSRSEALRRAIRAAAHPQRPRGPLEPVRALERVQRALALRSADADRWSATARRERRATARRRESRSA
jgi:hypothetical protein